MAIYKVAVLLPARRWEVGPRRGQKVIVENLFIHHLNANGRGPIVFILADARLRLVIYLNDLAKSGN